MSLVEWKADFFLFESLSLVKTAQLEEKKYLFVFYAMKFLNIFHYYFHNKNAENIIVSLEKRIDFQSQI